MTPISEKRQKLIRAQIKYLLSGFQNKTTVINEPKHISFELLPTKTTCMQETWTTKLPPGRQGHERKAKIDIWTNPNKSLNKRLCECDLKFTNMPSEENDEQQAKNSQRVDFFGEQNKSVKND